MTRLRPRHIAAVALILALTLAGFIVARALAERDARRDSEQRVDVAAAQIRGRVEVATSLTDSLRRFMAGEGAVGVTNAEFTRSALRWLSPAGVPAAAWAEEVRAADRAEYERRIGRPIVAPDRRREAVPPGSSSLPATLVSGFPPMNSHGVDLSRERGIAAALRRVISPGIAATPIAARNDGTRGLFVVAPAPNVIDGVLRPGAVVVFLSEATLRAAARNPAGLRFPSADSPSPDRGDTVRDKFAVAGQQFAVEMPKAAVSRPGAALPWIIVAGGLLLAALAAALGVIATRRARAQQDLDRIFNLSTDVVAVADFDGYFTRLNPAAEQVLGYTEDELLARPYQEFVHPDDREKTAAERVAIGNGKMTSGFENRYVRKDGSYRVLEWTATPVLQEHRMYSVGRDVTDRRRVEAEIERLADEQAALRRVATLVATESSPTEVFAKVAEEVALVLGNVDCALWRDEGDGTARAVAVHGASVAAAGIRVGTRLSLDGESVTARVLRQGRPTRIEDYSAATGTIATRAREVGIRAATGWPVVVGRRTWGVMAVATHGSEPIPPGTETRLERFSELVATSIANAQARMEVERLAEEQAALRRVATLVAQSVPAAEIFSAVSEEVGRLLGTELASVARFEHVPPANVVVGVASSVPGITVGSRWELDDSMASTQVYRTGRAARVDRSNWSQVSAAIGEPARRLSVVTTISSPIVVEGRLWGVLSVAANKPLPARSEERLGKFGEVVATAIASAESRDALRQLVEEQAALRRVATLVAQGASPTAVFDAVAAEIERLLDADQAVLSRYEAAAETTVVANRGADAHRTPPGTRVRLDGDNVETIVRQTGQPARSENAGIADLAGDPGVRSVIGAPIVVDGRLWGVISASWNDEEPPPADTEERMAQFAQLLDAAIANADSRDQLTASRARLVNANDDARRRVVRDLHDGAQQRLVHTIVTLKLAKQALGERDGEAAALVGEALEHAQQGNTELRELAHGILPAALTQDGLRAGVDLLVQRLDLHVDVDVPAQRFPAEIEASAYFIVAETLTNVLKHAQARHAGVRVTVADGVLRVEVRDDGVGGADPDGHGLVGIGDRVSALGGRLHIESTPGSGTLIAADLLLPTG